MNFYEDANSQTTLVMDGAKASDCYNIAEDSVVKCRRVVFFHLTRAEGGKCSLKALEDFKDGAFNTTKYRGRRNKGLGYKHPHVIVLSNEKIKYMNDESENTMTLGRLKIGYLDSTLEPIRWFGVTEEGAEYETQLGDMPEESLCHSSDESETD